MSENPNEQINDWLTGPGRWVLLAVIAVLIVAAIITGIVN